MFCRDDIAYGGNGDDDCDNDEMRAEAVWIVILISDGVPNAGVWGDNAPSSLDDWICPTDTWEPPVGTGPP